MDAQHITFRAVRFTALIGILTLTSCDVADEKAMKIIAQDDAKKAAALEEYLAENPAATGRPAAVDELIELYGRSGDDVARNRMLEKKYKLVLRDPKFQEMKSFIEGKDFMNTLNMMVQLNVLQGQKEKAAEYLQQARADVASHRKKEFLLAYIDQISGALRRPEAGDTISLKLMSLQGQEMDLAKMRGKVVILQFWSTTCSPCIRELPELQELYDKYRGDGLEMVGVALDDDADAVRDFLSEHANSWPHHCDGKGFQSEAAISLGIMALPTVFVIGKDGKVVADETNGKKLEAIVRRELGK